mmetsp:Transcript_109288/g.315877  ORF Transcript_109288/g.315877 Transcript_109288/m.315877 type:complete len:200 (-) Transcript_109288:443-1042(-)
MHHRRQAMGLLGLHWVTTAMSDENGDAASWWQIDVSLAFRADRDTEDGGQTIAGSSSLDGSSLMNACAPQIMRPLGPTGCHRQPPPAAVANRRRTAAPRAARRRRAPVAPNRSARTAATGTNPAARAAPASRPWTGGWSGSPRCSASAAPPCARTCAAPRSAAAPTRPGACRTTSASKYLAPCQGRRLCMATKLLSRWM